MDSNAHKSRSPIYCIGPCENSESVDYHFIDVKWDSIPMLSVLTGKNGIGKSTVLKMINYYFNIVHSNDITKIKKLKYNCNNGETGPCINVSLVHFDNNSIDLRSRDFTCKTYEQLNPINKENNFSTEIKKLETELIEKTSIAIFLKKKKLKKGLFNYLKEYFKQTTEMPHLEINHFKSEIKFKEYFYALNAVKRIEFLTSILMFKKIESSNHQFQSDQSIKNKKDIFLQKITSIRRILIDNITNLEEINELLKKSKSIFQQIIFIEIKSKVTPLKNS